VRAAIGAISALLASYGSAVAQWAAIGPEEVSAQYAVKCANGSLRIAWSTNRIRANTQLLEFAIDGRSMNSALFGQVAQAIAPFSYIEKFNVVCGVEMRPGAKPGEYPIPSSVPADYFVVEIFGSHPDNLKATDKCSEKGGRLERNSTYLIVSKTKVEVDSRSPGTCYKDGSTGTPVDIKTL
jgi:hypothetical protein